MTFQVVRNGEEIGITGTGRILIDDAIAGVGEVRGVDPDHETSHTVLDFTSAEQFDFTVDEFHRLALAIRRMYPRGPQYRFAMVAPSTAIEGMLRLFVDVRDLLTARQVEELPQIGIFETVDDARAWASVPQPR